MLVDDHVKGNRGVTLWVKVDDEDAALFENECASEVHGRRRLACPAFIVTDSKDAGMGFLAVRVDRRQMRPRLLLTTRCFCSPSHTPPPGNHEYLQPLESVIILIEDFTEKRKTLDNRLDTLAGSAVKTLAAMLRATEQNGRSYVLGEGWRCT